MRPDEVRAEEADRLRYVGHHPTKIGTRWTVSRRARFELLDLLLEENHRPAGLLP